MQDNISKSKYGNPTSRQTLVQPRRTSDPCEDGPPSKRQKRELSQLSQNRAIPNTTTSSRGHRAPQRVDDKLHPRTRIPLGVEVNVIDDDDEEDIGTHITRMGEPVSSPDPLRLGSDSAQSSVFPAGNRPPRPAIHPFEVDEPMVPGSSHTKDSKTVQQLRQRNNDRKRKPEVNEIPDSETDSIQEFDDDVKAGPSKRGQGSTQANENVRNKIEFFEEQDRKNVPHVDLTSVNKPRQHRPVAGNMKPKSKQTEKSVLVNNLEMPILGDTLIHKLQHMLKFKKRPNSNQGYDVPDALSAPSLRVPKSSKITAAGRVDTPFMLPLQAWFLGVKMQPEGENAQPLRDSLGWDEGASTVTIFRRSTSHLYHQLEVFHLEQMQGILVTNQDQLPENVVIKLQSRKYTRKSGAFTGSDQFYVPGSRGADGYVTFKFLKDDPQWDDSRYQRLVTFLRNNVTGGRSIVDNNGALAAWSLVEQAAEMKKMEIDRTDSRPTQPSTSRLSAQSDIMPTTGSRPKPRPAYKGANGSVTDLSAPVRRSTRQPPSRKSKSADPDELILVYPPSGTGAINITQGDINRLEPGEYLNDTLIEFGLKLWLSEIREKDPDLADQIHVFSSFFYKKLKNNTKNPEEGYKSVRKWTQKFDLFQKKFLIVPINEHLHWYLAIIYQPENVLLPPPTTAVSSISTRTRKSQSGTVDQQIPPATTSDLSPPLRDQTEEAVACRPPHSATGNDGEVEKMFDRSCSISVGHSNVTSTASSSIAEHNDTLPEADSIVVDDDGELHELQYPSPDEATFQMDVDELTGDQIMDEDRMTPEISATSSKPLSKDRGSRADSEAPNLVSLNSEAVGANDFYSSGVRKGKEKEKEKAAIRPFPLDVVDVSCSDDGEQDEVDELLNEPDSAVQFDQPTTYIFTLDSLGSKHPQAIKFLRSYLKMEAKDKKNIVDSSDAKGCQAFVPVQPNFCDCGLYLLHFAKTFVKRPEHHCKVILSRSKKNLIERQVEWDDVDARAFRENFKFRAEELSQVWKREHAAKQAQKGKDSSKQDSSDSDVDIVEDTAQSAKPAPSKTKAARIRG
ncbi:hypothetical protein PILCRDRAFT_84870 [Piloderma croceum F 1598]|uniref:Ubiquitin-like protease family profile domain-containing protein n=1 Tax=Piloderma croceum (strain F 1598) TaxID=765440 RepID=A0A0C3BRH0_PILCF|nr:hypothetical protein PILCRDRAFT_84870 [Piloderma croceum F 1598]